MITRVIPIAAYNLKHSLNKNEAYKAYNPRMASQIGPDTCQMAYLWDLARIFDRQGVFGKAFNTSGWGGAKLD